MVKHGFLASGTVALLATCALVVASPGLAHGASVSHALQVKFEAIDAPVEKASSVWTSAVAALPTSVNSSTLDKTLSKTSPPFDSALKAFDTALAALHLPGSAGTDASAIIAQHKGFEGLLGSASHISVSQFETQFRAIFSKDAALESNFKSAMGLEADASMVI